MHDLTYDGLQYHNATHVYPLEEGFVSRERERLFSSFTTPNQWNTYPSPSHAIIFDPAMGVEEARNLIEARMSARYVDLQTRALFVDFSVYNPMLDRVCWCRLSAEILETGGVVTSDFSQYIASEQRAEAPLAQLGGEVLLRGLHHVWEVLG